LMARMAGLRLREGGVGGRTNRSCPPANDMCRSTDGEPVL
jgi:hypothetical protein